MTFDINKDRYSEKGITSLNNLLIFKSSSFHKVWVEKIFTFHNMFYSENLNEVRSMISDIYGRWDLVKDYSYRNYIWTFTRDDMIIYLFASKRGVSFEFNLPDGYDIFNTKNNKNKDYFERLVDFSSDIINYGELNDRK